MTRSTMILRPWIAFGLAAALALPPAALAQDTRPGLAVLPFENGGSYGKSKEDFAALERGIAAMLVSELTRNPAARVVDRAEIQRLLDEQNLAESGRVDAATAAKVGKLVGARYMVAGTFIDLYGEFRIDARIIDVETGQILKTERSDPKLKEAKQLFAMIESLADRIMSGVRLPSLAARTRDVPTEALMHYSRALLYEDRGERSKAMEFYQKAVDAFPDYAEAREGLRKAGGF